MDSSILDREPLCARSLSDTLSHIRRRGYLVSHGVSEEARSKCEMQGASRAKLTAIKRWDVDRVQQWLTEAASDLQRKYGEKLRRRRIDGAQLVSGCGSSKFLRGVVGMDCHSDVNRFLNVLGELKGDPAPDITLAHVDEHGKPMTAKEAFRKLSHKFHGKKSGPKKEEKRLKKRKEEMMRRSRGHLVDTPLGTLEKLKVATKQIQKPFVVLDKN